MALPGSKVTVGAKQDDGNGVVLISSCLLQSRKGEADSTPDDILEMVKAQALPAHR